jgi:eukaryotic-like serine/threonine-protein kinase
MTYCPECGSEIEPENTFCAYCGMALTPIVPVIDTEQTADESSAAPSESIEEDLNVAVQAPESADSISEDAPDESEKAEELPPTLTVFDKPSPEMDWSMSNPESQTGSAPGQQTADNFPRSTEGSAAFPAFEAENQKISEEFLPDESPVSEIPTAAGEAAIEPSVDVLSAPGLTEEKPVFEEQSSPKTDFAEKSFSEDAEVSKKGIDQPEEPSLPDYGGAFDSSDEPDFQSTIPYTPRDFASQNLMVDKIEASQQIDETGAAEQPKDDFSDAEKPIAIPDIPVGSNAHDSLEPKFVSVQIYNPDEQPKDEGQLEAGESIHDSQTLLKHSIPQKQDQPDKPRSHTSPNMGGDDTDGRGKAKLKPLDEGTVLNGRYEIIRKIGGGGMGAVYLASDRNLGGVLRAVKEMVQSYIEDAQQEKAVNDFKRESLLLTSLEHPAIPTIFDYFYDEKEGRFYLVMKYISGGDLAGRLRSAPEGKVDETAATEWAIQIADVLDYLHNRQPPIVYRDLKPSNIMIDGNTGRVMLIDFGIARWVNKEEKGVTAVGTMGYAPPELFSGNVEPRSDIYSLGSTMFHLLTGADPQSNPLLIFDFHKNPRPRQINPTLSDQIEQILMRMVEYSADKRYHSAAELRDALAKHLENLKKGAVTHGTEETAPAPVVGGLVFCGFCGQKIVATDVFCPFCGAQQPLAGQAGKAAPAFVAPKLTAKIMIISTNELDTPMFNLEKDNNLVGRRDPMSNIFPEVDLSKFDPQTKISRRHARIWRESDTFMVEDLGSSNGTVLITKTNETLRLTKNQPHVLTHGDKLRVGDTTLHFVIS